MLYTKVFIRQHTGVSLVVRHVDKLLSIAACPSLPPPQYICVNDFGRIVCCSGETEQSLRFNSYIRPTVRVWTTSVRIHVRFFDHIASDNFWTQVTTSEGMVFPGLPLYTALHTSAQPVHQESCGEKAYGDRAYDYVASETDATP